MKKIIIVIFLFGLFSNYAHAQKYSKEQKVQAVEIGAGLFQRVGEYVMVTNRTKKSNKQIAKWKKSGDNCALQCHRLNEGTGKIEYDLKCESKCHYDESVQKQMESGRNVATNSNTVPENVSRINDEAEKAKAEEAKRVAEEKATEEAKRQAELQRQEAERKAAEERKNTIQKLETTKIEVYSFDETALSGNQKLELDAIVDILNRYSDIKILIVGHTCDIGYKNVNQRKGLKRAEAAKEYLIEKGVSYERISIDSKAETQPLVPNTSNENRKQNRRIEFLIEK